MMIIRRTGAALGVLLFVLGWLLVFAGPAAANPGMPDPPPDDNGSSSGGCGSGCGGHDQPKSDDGDHEPDPGQPRVLIVPGQPASPPKAPVRRAPVAPAAPVDPGGDFVPALPPGSPPPAPVLEQIATSHVPASLTPTGPAPDGGSGPSDWLVPALVTAAAGAALVSPGRREPEQPTGEFAGPAGRFAQAALGGMVNAGPPAGGHKPPFDLKQHAWDWGGHYLGAAIPLVPAILGAPVTGPMVAAGIAVAAASELKRRWWPSKPLTVNDLVGGNPYQRMQQSGNDGLGQKVRDAHGGAELRQELGPDGNQTTTWGQGTHDVHQETGGQTSSRGDAYRDAIK